MRCPKCDNKQSNTVECEACGLLFAKYERFQKLQKVRASQKNKEKEGSGGLLKFSQVLLLVLITAGITFYFTREKNSPIVAQSTIEPAEVASKIDPVETTVTTPQRHYSRATTQDTQPVVSETPIEQARKATVSIETPWGTGSGFFISEKYVVTNKHVVELDPQKIVEFRSKVERTRQLIELEKEKIQNLQRKLREFPSGPSRNQIKLIIQSMQENLDKILPQHEMAESKLTEMEQDVYPSDIKIILSDGTEHNANYLMVSEKYDLALMSLFANESRFLTKAPQGQFLRQGDKVYTIGSPVGLRHTVTAGIFSGYRKRKSSDQNYLQTDAPINPGNSGGPLIDERGYVYGVNTMILKDTEGIGFAIPIETVFEEFGTELY